jgi:hypothetical protein
MRGRPTAIEATPGQATFETRTAVPWWREAIHRSALLLAALLAATLTLAARADAFVYWPNYALGTVGRANLDGTGVDKEFIDAGSICGVGVSRAHVYWGWETRRDSGIGRANLDGSGVDKKLITGQSNGICLGEVGPGHLYWTSLSGGIARANLDGTAIERKFIPGRWPRQWPWDIAVDADHIYWTRYHVNLFARANLDGTGIDGSFITEVASPTGVAVDDQYIYWANEFGPEDGDGAIARANLDGSGIDQSFLLEPGQPSAVAVNATHVYWVDWSGRRTTVGRANLDGTDAVNDFVTGSGNVGEDIAVDALTFTLIRVRLNKEAGTARLMVRVPGPGNVRVAGTTKLKPADARTDTAGRLKLPVVPKGKATRLLNREGRAKVKARISFAPDSGAIERQPRPIVLVKQA